MTHPTQGSPGVRGINKQMSQRQKLGLPAQQESSLALAAPQTSPPHVLGCSGKTGFSAASAWTLGPRSRNSTGPGARSSGSSKPWLVNWSKSSTLSASVSSSVKWGQCLLTTGFLCGLKELTANTYVVLALHQAHPSVHPTPTAY